MMDVLLGDPPLLYEDATFSHHDACYEQKENGSHKMIVFVNDSFSSMNTVFKFCLM